MEQATRITAVPFTWDSHPRRDAALRSLAFDAGEKPAIRFFTSEILAKAGTPEKSIYADARTLRAWMRTNVKYQREAGEQIVLPPLLLSRPELGYDCDDQAVALAAMMISIGWQDRVRFNYWGNPLSHISVGVLGPQGWKNVDPTEDREIGWTPNQQLTAGKPIGPTRGSLHGAQNAAMFAPVAVALLGVAALISWKLTK
jgi:transglutaminase-like putative cysteine protease